MPPTIDPTEARKFAVDVVRQLRGAGFEALWAGGCVRDQLLGNEPKDYDVATSATPEQVRALFGKRKTLAIGVSFGVISVLGPRTAGTIEVATFRRDAAYSDGRHPDSVVFSTAKEDSLRRDFTINGLFYDPLEERVIDYVGGAADLARKIVRAIRDPHERFAEDKLRMLRAVRFAATFDFDLEEATMAAIVQHAPEITVVSAERIAAELRRMLADSHRARAMELLHRSGLLAVVWPEAAAMRPDSSWSRALAVLAALEKPGFPVALAAVLRETTESASAPPAARADVVEQVCRRWKLSNEERETALWVLAHEAQIRHARSLPWPRVQRILISDRVEPLMCLAEGVARAVDRDTTGVDFCRQCLALPPEELDPPPLLTGNDLKRAGIHPGPRYKELLDSVRDAQLEKRITTKDDALVLVRELLKPAAD